MNPSYLHIKKDGRLLVSVHVQPNASATQLVGLHGDALKVRLQSPPVDGKANKALIAYFARLLGLPKSSVRISKGKSSRAKTLEVRGIDQATLCSLLQR